MINAKKRLVATATVISVFIVAMASPLPIMAAESKKPVVKYTDRTQVVNAYVSTFNTHQTLDGFGGAFTWWSDLVTKSPYKQEIMDLIFKDANLNIIRLRNTYYDRKPDASFTADGELVKLANIAAGHKVKVLLSSWSQSPDLKSNGIINGGGSIKKDKDGKYMYKEYGEYWKELLGVYAKSGVVPDYISIQNEPDFNAGYDGCEFKPQETEEEAAYYKAFESVYSNIKSLPNAPKMMGPETMSADFQKVSSYIDPIIKKDPKALGGIGYHLYAGGSHEKPDSFNKSLNQMVEKYPNLTKWQTEFFRGTPLQYAWTINNTLVEGNANAYIYWYGVWRDYGMVGLGDPSKKETWKNDKGYWIGGDNFYVMKHYSKFTEAGYKRVDASIDLGVKDIKMSAFTSPGQDKLTLVLLNTKTANSNVKLDLNGYIVDKSEVYLSNFQENATDKFALKGSLGEDMTVNLPAQSMVTVTITGKPGEKPEAIKNAQNSTVEVADIFFGEKTEAIKGTPVIDGEMDVFWKKAVEVKPVTVGQGDSGATSRFRTMWDENYFYIFADVTDKVLNEDSKKTYEQDSLELFMNEDGKRPLAYGDTDFQYRVSYTNKKSAGSDKVPIDKFITATKQTDRGYIVEAAIPLIKEKGAIGRVIGFDFQVNDAFASGKREYVLKWADPSGSTWGTLVDVGLVTFVETKTKTAQAEVKSEYIKVLVDDNEVVFTEPKPMVVDGRTLVPFRKIFEQLKAKVYWNDTTKTVTAIKENTKIELPIGKNTVKINGLEKAIDVSGFLINGRAMVPIRFISESLGAIVDWDEDSQTIAITTN